MFSWKRRKPPKIDPSSELKAAFKEWEKIQSTKPEPLHQLLTLHKSDVLVNRIKEEAELNLTIRDQCNRNLLQVAASKGFIQAVLWLIYAGVATDLALPSDASATELHPSQRTPLYQAILNNQWFTAQILLVCGADKDLAIAQACQESQHDYAKVLISLEIDAEIREGMIFWAVKNYHPNFRNRLLDLLQIPVISTQSPAQDKPLLETKSAFQMGLFVDQEPGRTPEKSSDNNILQGAVEYLAAHKQFRAAKHLFGRNKPRTSPYHITLAHWVVEEDKEFYNSIKDDDAHIARMLEDMGGGHKSYFTQLSLASTPQRDLYLHTAETSHTQRSFTVAEDKIFEAAASMQKKALLPFLKPRKVNPLSAARNKPSDQLSLIELPVRKANETDETRQNFLTVLSVMVDHNNFIASSLLIDILGMKAVLNHALRTNNKKLFIFTLFATDQFLFECLPTLKYQLAQVATLFSNEMDGLLHRCVDQGCAGKFKDSRDQSEISTQTLFFAFLKCGKTEIFPLLLKIIFSLYTPFSINDNAINVMPLRIKKLICDMGWRFQIDFSSRLLDSKSHASAKELFFSKESGPLVITFNFLNNKDRNNLSAVSREVNSISINSDIIILHAFLNNLNNEINNKGYFSNRHYNLTNKEIIRLIIYALLVGALLGFSIKLGEHNNERNEIRDEMKAAGCESYIRTDRDQCYPPLSFIDKPCQSFCSRLAAGLALLVLLSIGTGLSGLGFFVSLLWLLDNRTRDLDAFREIYRALTEDTSRFNDSTLAIFSQELRTDYRKMIERFRHLNLDLSANSTVLEIKEMLRGVLENLITTQRNLYPTDSTVRSQISDAVGIDIEAEEDPSPYLGAGPGPARAI